jgi:hypothetical protein
MKASVPVLSRKKDPDAAIYAYATLMCSPNTWKYVIKILHREDLLDQVGASIEDHEVLYSWINKKLGHTYTSSEAMQSHGNGDVRCPDTDLSQQCYQSPKHSSGRWVDDLLSFATLILLGHSRRTRQQVRPGQR